MGHRADDLLEEFGGLLLAQPLAAAHVRVHVAVLLLEKHVGLALALDDFHDPGDVPVPGEVDVRLDFVLVVLQGENLQTKHKCNVIQMSKPKVN